jgi:uncharacterized membrane protein
LGSQIEETESKKELGEMYSKQEQAIKIASEKPKWKSSLRGWLHHGGIMVAILGGVLIAGPFNIYAGNPEFDVIAQVLAGTSLIIIGILMFLLINE